MPNKLKSSQPQSSSASYREVYLWTYNFDQILGLDKGNGLDLELTTLLSKMTTWLGKLYDVVAESTFEAYQKQLLNYKEMKIFFAACLILHTVRFMKYLANNHVDFWLKHRLQIIKNYDQNSKLALQFLMMKFPQKQTGYVDPEIEKLLPVFDRTEDPNVEILNQIGVRFTGENTLQQIKQMMNTLIRTSKNLVDSFRKQMVQIFTVPQNEGKPLYNMVGMKFRDTMQQYSENQIKELGMKIKGPEMLRIMIKWIEELEKKCVEVEKFIINRYYPFNTKKGELKKLTYKQKDQLAARIKEKLEAIRNVDKENVKQINSVLFDLFKFISIQKKNFKYIEEKEVTVGLFTHILSETVSNIVSEYLEYLIDSICQASEEIDFITFNVSDLLRCKCFGTKEQIKAVYKKLDQKFTIVRVKNRLRTSNNDFLVNFKFHNLTCEAQLGFKVQKKEQNKKPALLNDFSHFLYEMARSKFSALTEIVIINNHLNQTVGFFKDILKKGNKLVEQNNNLKQLKVILEKDTILIEGYLPVKNTFPMFCNFCWEYKGAYGSFLDMFVSSSGLNVCGECYTSCLTKEQITHYMLGDKLASFFDQIPLSHLTKLEGFEEYYVILLFKSFKKSINVFCKHKGIEEFCPVFSKFKSKYEFDSPAKLKSKSFFAFTIKEQLKTFKDLSQVVKNHNNVSFIEEGLTFESIKNPREELIFVQSSSQTLILNNENTEDTKRERYRQLKFQTLVDKNWWLMESEHIDENFFDNPKMDRALMKVNRLEVSDNNLKDIRFLSRNSSMVHLNISNNKIIEIDFTKFDFKSLKHLDVSRNILNNLRLSNCELNSLQTLIASSNKLTGFYVEEANLQSLQVLKLNSNRLEVIQGFKDMELQKLEVIRLEENLMSDIKFLLKGSKNNNTNMRLPKLRELFIEKNRIKSFEGFISSGIESLQHISFGSPSQMELSSWGNCKLRFLKVLEIKQGSKILDGLKTLTKFFSLKKIIIQQNSLGTLELSDLNLKNLESLIITENKLSKIEGLKRVTLNSLKILDLTKNTLHDFNFTNINLQELTHLHLQNNNLNKIQGIMSASLPNLKQLHLEHNQLTEFNLAEVPFKQLQILNLSHNQLARVLGTQDPRGLSLNNLVSLHLQHNRLTVFDFPNLPSLEFIYLQENQIQQVRNLNRAVLPKLAEIQLFNNKISTNFDFKDVSLPSLRVLNLHDNQISNVSYLQLAKMPLLEELKLCKNRIQTIDFGNLNLPKLRVVNLSDNNLVEIKGLNKKTRLTELEKLILNKNRLRSFEFDRVDLPQLSELVLSDNEINPVINFKGAKLPVLKQINLEFNKIERVNFDEAYLPCIEIINLKNNTIKEVLNLRNTRLKSLKRIELDQNKLEYLDLGHVSLPSLESLQIRDNNLTLVDGFSSTELPNLKEINLENNQLQTFDMSSTNFNHLQKITLESNSLASINLEGAFLPNLTRISFKSNRIRDIKGIQTARLPKLEVMWLNKNQIVAVDFQIINMPKLLELNLDQNMIENVNFAGVELNHLKRLTFSSNLIVELDLTEMNMSSLEGLYLTNNKKLQVIKGLENAKLNNLIDFNLEGSSLEYVSFGKSQFDKLRNLNIVRNQLQTVDGLKEVRMSSLKCLRFSENQLKYANFKYFNFNSLIRLDLDDNKLEALDNLQYAKFPYLETLNLRKNNLKKIDFKNVFMYCLKHLILGDNKLTVVTGFLQARFPNLISLDLCNNRLRTLDVTSGFAMGQLRKLMLHNNKLQELVGVNQSLKMLEIVTLDNNPIHTESKYNYIRDNYSALSGERDQRPL